MSDRPRAWQPVMLPDPYPPPAGAYSPAVRASSKYPSRTVVGALLRGILVEINAVARLQ
ncbi:MAG: RidA family protein [Gemmatimonadota bacterium]|nr:RidA family protein [Gemmatimonadota bacterium]